MIYINEIFQSIQGEGRTVGKLSVFARLAGCNLTCSWCDSKFTWHKDFLEKGVGWNNADLADHIKQTYRATNIIFTGGEPTLQEEAIDEMIRYLPMQYTFEIETNGTRPLLYLGQFMTSINISPKLSNSGLDLPRRYRKSVLEALAGYDQAIFKFVITNVADVIEIEADFVEALHIPRERIYLMPEGFSRDDQNRIMQGVVGLCQTYGFNFSPRLQVLIYNTRRKV
jgi:7-carboxy-7-deazaguanine synthase